MDLLKINSINRVLKKRPLQFILQLPFVLLFFILIAAGLFGSQFPDRNLATIVTWTVWWGGVIFTFLFLGRFWCAVCPWAAVADWVQRFSLWRVNDAPLTLGLIWPVRLRNLYLMAGTFVLITWAEFAFDMVTSPRNTAYLAIVILFAVIITSLLYERRTFCRYVCPIGGMIAVYSTCSTLELGAREGSICRNCHTKDCVNGNGKGYGCPVYEYPERMETASRCILCTECIKTCPHDNISIKPRPVASELLKHREWQLDEALMAALVAGIALFHGLTMIPHWFRLQEVFYYGYGVAPVAAAAAGLIIFLLIVMAFYWLSAVVSGVGFGRLALALVPLALFFHLGHNCLHLFGEGGRFFSVMSDPFGWGWDLFGTAGKRIGPLIPVPAINLIQWMFVAAGFIISLFVVWKKGEGVRERVAMGVAVTVITSIYVWMLNQPMVMRIGM
jgi:ferredoxin